MKEFFLTSTIPYWVVFALVATACVMELLNLRKGAVSKQSVLMVTVLALGGTILELLIYTSVGGNVLWWCTADELGFFARLLRVIPLFLFLAMQLGHVFLYKWFVQQHYGKELSVKSSLISMVALVPICIVMFIVMSIMKVSDTTRDISFYALLALAIVAGTGWAMTKNVKSIGFKDGAIFTGVCFILIIGGVLSILLAIMAIIHLFLTIATVVVVAGGVLYLFSSGISKEFVKSSPSRPVFYDDDCHAHYSTGSRDNANRQIKERKENG